MAYEVLKTVTDVRCLIDGGFTIAKRDVINPDDGPYYLEVTGCDGECIDLLQLQEWFDRNRDWINGLREVIK